MDLLLDSADLSQIRYALDHYPIKGITTNPTMLARIGSNSLLSHLQDIRKLIGDELSLHIQVMGDDPKTMVGEAHRLQSLFGEQTYVAIPVTKAGLEAIKILAKEPINITATTVFSTIQGILAMVSGVRYIAVYYDRMLNLDINASKVIKELAGLLWTNTSATQLLAASFRNVAEVTTAYSAGAGCCTLKLDLLQTGLSMPSIAKAVEDFNKDWHSVYNLKTLLDF
ncbi:MAG: fructose-6-phosphate aldolase [Spirochaetia bacterium]|nr:fructose-6-phosphate aldolase [Spirochaetia bacterium]